MGRKSEMARGAAADPADVGSMDGISSMDLSHEMLTASSSFMRRPSTAQAEARSQRNVVLGDMGMVAAAQKKSVHVCFISPFGSALYDDQLGCSGGAELQLFLLANSLSSEANYRVTVLTTTSVGTGTEQVGRIVLIKRRAGGRLNRAAPGRWQAAKRVKGYLAAFAEMFALLRAINADVYVHAGAGVEVGAYALICRFINRAFVFVVASSADLCRPYGNLSAPLRWLYPLGVRCADAVVCRSEEQQQWLHARFRRQGFLVRTAHPEDDPPAGRPPSRPKRDTVLWVGRINPLKRPNAFLEIARRHPQERCVIVMMKDETHVRLWQEIHEQAIAVPNLLVHENVAWHAMRGFFEEAKVLICTSEYEGFPNTFVQAAMAGTPILSWSVDPDGVLARYGIGMCAHGSFDTLLSIVERFLSSPSLRDEYGSRASAYAVEHHRLSQVVQRFMQVVRPLAERA
jgi:glycosyltransferase involved in cell wall biosynthesis